MSRTVLIIGAGARVGQALADKFGKEGYKVAVASRSNKTIGDYKFFPIDLTKSETVADLFSRVRKEVGTPSVVIYNAYGGRWGSAPDPLSVSLDDFNTDLAVNTTSVFASATEAVKGFRELQTKGELGSTGATFIFTGNLLNDSASRNFAVFGAQKAASAILIKNLALVEYLDQPFKFYYGDQRHPDGEPLPTGLSGPAHAETYFKLAENLEQGPWQQTFVEGIGYREFPKKEIWNNKL